MANNECLDIVAARMSYDTVTIHIAAKNIDNHSNGLQSFTRFVQLPQPFTDLIVKCELTSEWFIDLKVFASLSSYANVQLTTYIVKNGEMMDLHSFYPMTSSVYGRLDTNKLMQWFHEDGSLHFQAVIKSNDTCLFEKYVHVVDTYEKGHNADMTLLTEHQPINANKAVLVQHSRVFEDMIRTSQDEGVISLPEEADVMSELVFSMHTGHARLANVNFALKLLELSLTYGVESVKNQSYVYLCREMSPASVRSLMNPTESNATNTYPTEEEEDLQESRDSIKLINKSQDLDCLPNDFNDDHFAKSVCQPSLTEYINVKLTDDDTVHLSTEIIDAMVEGGENKSDSIEIVSPATLPETDESDSIYVVSDAEEPSNEQLMSHRTSVSSIVALGEESTCDSYTFVDKFTNGEYDSFEHEHKKFALAKIEELGNWFETERGADVTLIMNGQKLRASKLFMVNSSSVFEELLRAANEVTIAGIDYEVMRALVKSFYVGYVDIPDVLFALRLINAADNYKVKQAKTQAEEYIRQAQEQN